MMRVDSVRIGACEVPVISVPYVEMAEDNAEADYSPITLRIRMSSELPPPKQAQLLMHECTHAMIDDSGYEFPSEAIEEAFVSAFSPRLTAFIADNRGAIEELWRMLGVE